MMSARPAPRLALGLVLAGLLCWTVMFMAGTDVWHDVGRPDIWNLAGVPWHDLRAFAVAFYLLLPVLLVLLVVTGLDLTTNRRGTRNVA